MNKFNHCIQAASVAFVTTPGKCISERKPGFANHNQSILRNRSLYFPMQCLLRVFPVPCRIMNTLPMTC